MKLYISPTYNTPDKADGGIRRVIEAMVKHLPDHGFEIVNTPEESEIVNAHAAAYVSHLGKPLVASCHGLYWSDYEWPQGIDGINHAVIETMARAEAVTVPSDWVGNAIARGILADITTVYHGVDTVFWEPTKYHNKYVLWNKARADIISNPNDIMHLASLMPDVQFKTTIGAPRPNVEVMGVVPYPNMVQAVKGAGVYLATARETFGIGTLEALAAGVPVAGWDFGGQSEIIKQGETGYLAPFGNYERLAECVNLCIQNREILSFNARKDAIARWQWPDKIAQYAEIFTRVYRDWYKPRPKYTVIVPAYNKAKYITETLDSIKAQTAKDFECIIIDDASTDNTQDILQSYALDKRFQYIRLKENVGLCMVRNLGIEKANGRYINFTDSDDLLPPKALETLGEWLDTHPETQIAYGRLDLMNQDGTKRKKGAPAEPYNYLSQMAHIHQFPIGGALIRRKTAILSGGFRVRDWRAEDAAWIARVTSFGHRAHKATDENTILYRVLPDSKSVKEAQADPETPDGNWLAWLGWALAKTRKEGELALKGGAVPPPYLLPFSAQDRGLSRSVSHHQNPLVSVIIPVGPNHQRYLMDAVDSLLAQSVPFWECIVINDTGAPLPHQRGNKLSYAPWVKLIETEGERGAGVARNLGAKNASAPLLLFLDCDDWLLSGGIDSFLGGYQAQGGEKYIYSNYIAVDPNGRITHEKMKEYNQAEWKAQHGVTILIDKADFLAVGGFDEELGGWEDWDLPLKLAVNGICGHHIPDETFVYKKFSGYRRTWAVKRQSELLAKFRAKFGPYYEGDRPVAKKKCCGGSQAAQNILHVKSMYQQIPERTTETTASNSVRLEFVGSERGSITFERIGGVRLSKKYRGANTHSLRYINAAPQDAALLVSSGKWARVARSQPQTVNIPKKVKIPQFTEPPKKKTPPDPEITQKARTEAEEGGLNWRTLNGTGKNGKITVADVREALANVA